MGQRSVMSILLMLLLAGFASGADLADTVRPGTYVLKMEGLSRYGTDFLVVRAADGKGVTGEVGIDWGIGPQAREPQEWERLYREAYRATAVSEGRAFTFAVTVAGRRRYEFTLFPVRDRQWRPLLVGFVTITATNQSERFRDGRYGVVAEPREKSE